MTKSEQIRQLAQQGLSTSEIARTLNIRYQFAYGVLSRSGTRAPKSSVTVAPLAKPVLTTSMLEQAGFSLAARWMDDGAGGLLLSKKLTNLPGVYAFAIDGAVVYVGLASMGLAKRIYFYRKPAATQRTSLRLNAVLRELLSNSTIVDIYVATPEDGEWNGLPVDRCAGLELGLIRNFHLPWNKRSAGASTQSP